MCNTYKCFLLSNHNLHLSSPHSKIFIKSFSPIHTRIKPNPILDGRCQKKSVYPSINKKASIKRSRVQVCYQFALHTKLHKIAVVKNIQSIAVESKCANKLHSTQNKRSKKFTHGYDDLQWLIVWLFINQGNCNPSTNHLLGPTLSRVNHKIKSISFIYNIWDITNNHSNLKSSGYLERSSLNKSIVHYVFVIPQAEFKSAWFE